MIGPLSNDENFSKAFGCKAGQPMSNVNKCHVSLRYLFFFLLSSSLLMAFRIGLVKSI